VAVFRTQDTSFRHGLANIKGLRTPRSLPKNQTLPDSVGTLAGGLSYADKRFKRGLTSTVVPPMSLYGCYVNPRAAAGRRATLIRIAFATPDPIPRARRSVLVTNRSSPTS
jgi:hypothetical protein